MASRASTERDRPSRVCEGTLLELPLASSLPEGGELSNSTESGVSVDSTSSVVCLMRDLARAPPGADLESIARAFWASPHRSMNRPIVSSREPTADVLLPLDPGAPSGSYLQSPAVTRNPHHPGAPYGSHSPSAAVTEAGTGLTGTRQQPDASSNNAHPEVSARSQWPEAMEFGRAVSVRGRPFHVDPL
eukprot:TRINITY_DN8153_c0_g1_i4.p1 TRINITY_DN8153_c0_g1~~TRINITY_DN8153_c0_g1_i4.p1  ORF type:complete len:189 (+),score=13.61 TRINITY_DN8153_c0_g1_i4:75-641(+)